jgi:hypothetical protein
VFTSLEKFDGTVQRPLTPGEVKQIAGRAGRFGTRYDAGVVTCLHRVRARARLGNPGSLETCAMGGLDVTPACRRHRHLPAPGARPRRASGSAGARRHGMP